MEMHEDILDAPQTRPSVARVFTFIGLLGVVLNEVSIWLMAYNMSLFNSRFKGLEILNVPDWVLYAFLLSGFTVLVGIIGSFIRKEPGGLLRWFIMLAGGASLVWLVSIFAK